MPVNAAYKDLTKETRERLQACEQHWLKVRLWIDDVQAFTQPRKVRKDSERALTEESSLDIFTSIGIEVNNDFASDVLAAFTPEDIEWVDLEPGIAIPDRESETVKDALKALKQSVFKQIARSNFYTVAPQAYKDFGTTTGAVFIQDIAAVLPANVQHVPINELRILTGPLGGVDDRFWVREVYWKDLKALFPKDWESFPQDFRTKIRDKPMDRVGVVMGGWRDWSDVTQERWQWINMIVTGRGTKSGYGAAADGWLFAPMMLEGAGSMPLIVGRWDPDSDSPWGTGPGFNALADLRSLDDVNYNIVENIGRTVNPPHIYPEDGIINPRDGVDAGDWLPAARGTSEEVKPLNTGARLDLGYLTKEDFELTVRRHYFQDQPIQRGKTPPTLGQWLDEAQRIQKRLGVPASPLFTEFAAEVWLRFHRIGVNRGDYSPIKLKNSDVVQMTPVNPIRRAQKQEDVMLATRLLEIITAFFPNIAEALIDPETIVNIKRALGDDLVKLRDADEAQIIGLVKQAIERGGAQGAGAGPPTSPVAEAA